MGITKDPTIKTANRAVYFPAYEKGKKFSLFSFGKKFVVSQSSDMFTNPFWIWFLKQA